jgi:thiamine-phosphate pyrophosphorylase
LNLIPFIYPITDRRLSGLSHAEQVKLLIAGGARFIQLREKHASPREFYDDAEKANAIARSNNVKILINDRVDIALALKADGVHLGQDDLPPEYARQILGDNAIIGFSTHSVSQAIAAAKLPVDYIAIGPIFRTSTKENPDETVGPGGLTAVRNAIGDLPLVAIGGITSANLVDVLKAGADSCAIISDLFSGPETIEEKLALLDRIANPLC